MHLSELTYLPTPYLLAFQLLVLLGVYFVVQTLLGHRLGKAGAVGAVVVSGVAFLMGLGFWYWSDPQNLELWQGDLPPNVHITWLSIGGDLRINLGFDITWLHRTMLPMVTGITFLVHLFSLAYMKDDKYNHRYWAYLSLFSLAMCGVVLADNFMMIFLFWELMGLASYFLIGFWFEQRIPARASQKAFIINRIGDLGFVVALMAMYAAYGSFSPNEIIEQMISNGDKISGELNFLIGIGLLLGVMGKSAQFPLQVWLPDAMAGPTPVSSLIHAATMVAAGVFLLLQAGIFFSDGIFRLVTLVGCATALMAAISALTQNDIKRVLAYSTISQLGFMVAGIGMGAFNASFFHLITHAFFKCGLFLVAGAVIHRMHQAQHQAGVKFDVQDLRWLGGLRKKMPLTFAVYLVFAAALIGLPFTSGFLSKDGILLQAVAYGLHGGGWAMLAPVSLLLASLCTAFYITRHGMLIFGGDFRAARRAEFKEVAPHIREVNWLMAVPLLVLAAFSLWVVYSPLQPFHVEFGHALENISYGGAMPGWLPWMFVGIAAAGIAGGWFIYFNGPGLGPRRVLFQFSFNHFFLDEFYREVVARFWLWLSGIMARLDERIVDGVVNRIADAVVRKDEKRSVSQGSAWVERHVIDRLVNGAAGLALRIGQQFRQMQTGKLQLYMAYTLLSVLLLLLGLFYFAAK